MQSISPGVIISMLGLIGMVVAFIDNTGYIGSKVPLVIFFLFLIVLGIIYEAYPKENLEIYGEVEGRRGFS